MFDREKYRQESELVGPTLLGDLCRAKETDVEALKRVVGWKEEDFYGTTDPARSALRHFLRAWNAAVQVQQRAHEPGPSWKAAGSSASGADNV